MSESILTEEDKREIVEATTRTVLDQMPRCKCQKTDDDMGPAERLQQQRNDMARRALELTRRSKQ